MVAECEPCHNIVITEQKAPLPKMKHLGTTLDNEKVNKGNKYAFFDGCRYAVYRIYRSYGMQSRQWVTGSYHDPVTHTESDP